MSKKLFLSVLIALFTGIAHAGILDDIALVKKVYSCELLTKDIAATTIPFIIEQGEIMINVEVSNNNGTPRKEKFILDTGASTIFTEDFARSAGMQLEKIDLGNGKTALGQKNEAPKNYLASEPTLLKIGDMQLKKGHVLVSTIKITSIKCGTAKRTDRE